MSGNQQLKLLTAFDFVHQKCNGVRDSEQRHYTEFMNEIVCEVLNKAFRQN